MICDVCGAGTILHPDNKPGAEIFIAPDVHADWCPAKGLQELERGK